MSFPNIVGKARARGFGDVELIYLDSVIQGFWLEAIPHRRSVLRIGDSMAGFWQFTPEMRRLQRELAQAVDLVVYSAAGLREEVASLRPRAMAHIPNGVDFAHFASGDDSEPADLRTIPRPIVMYVGAMDEWFDFRAVNAIAGRLSRVSFVLIGPDSLARNRLKRRSNVHLLGPRPYGSLPGYLKNAQVGLIPFDVDGHPELVHKVHPLKLYEYFASGLPVVATRWDELQRLESPARLCTTVDDYVEAIEAALAEPTARDIGVSFAATADWSARLSQLLAALDF